MSLSLRAQIRINIRTALGRRSLVQLCNVVGGGFRGGGELDIELTPSPPPLLPSPLVSQ
ncbi:hypothetical protein J6590_105604, partial [Homalodisca vitripennis]